MEMESLKVYNTLSGTKEPFAPAKPGQVRMYVCGPTTYNFIHLGNARPLVVFDTVRRYLEYLGFEVTYIQNFTDVDDKIIKRAQEEKVSPEELVNKYIGEYFKDADALNVKRATVHPRVSEHMSDIIEFIGKLIDKGVAYAVDGDVYFAVSCFGEYGKLSKRNLEDLQAGARVEVDERKLNPADFALWKKAKPGEPWWDSPWGPGRPGWHIECSAMSHKYLGESFDIHGGGFDLIFPHHENEIAQSEALFGVPMARYWMHNGFITVNEEKMSKSLGNFFLVRDITAKFSPQVVRFYLLSTHYRSPLDFDDGKLEIAGKGLERLQTAYRLFKEYKSTATTGIERKTEAENYIQEVKGLHKRFLEAMNDDFNTALAIAVLFDLARAMNGFMSKGIEGNEAYKALMESAQIYEEMAKVLGIELESAVEQKDSGLVDGLMDLIIKVRQEARAKKDFATADAIRQGLKEIGIILEDTPQGVRWRYKSKGD
jgi:cysteinyl-tRNA synthetase